MQYAIITVAYDGPAIPGHEFHTSVNEVIETFDAGSCTIAVQNLPYFVTPNQIGMREVWVNQMTAEQREQLAKIFPQLAAAIHFMILGTQEVDLMMLIADDHPIRVEHIPLVEPTDLPLLRGASKANSPAIEEWLSLEPDDTDSDEHVRWKAHLNALRNRPEHLE